MHHEGLEKIIGGCSPEQLRALFLQLPEGTMDLMAHALRREHPYLPVDYEVGAIYLVAGTGERAPGSRKGPGYIRAKTTIDFLNKPLVHWHLDVIRSLGIGHIIIAGRMKENRQQTKRVVGYGENHNIKVRYTPSRFDLEKTGSADATRNALLHFMKEGPEYVRKYMLVIPCDQVFDLDLQAMKDAHVSNGAMVTIATNLVDVAKIADTYGLVLRDPKNPTIVTGLVEKPSLEKIAGLLDIRVQGLHFMKETMSGGIYLIATETFLDLMYSAPFGELYEKIREKEGVKFHGIDFGKHFLPWVLEQQRVMAAHPVRELGDLGNVVDYIETMKKALAKEYRSINQLGIGKMYDSENNVWIDPETLDWRYNGLTLRERIENGFVKLKNVNVGRFVKIEGTESNPVLIESSNIGDEAEIYEGCRINSSQIGRGSYIGKFAIVEQSYLGVECGLDESSPKNPIRVRNFTALGDEVRIYPGVKLEHGHRIGPKLHISAEYVLLPHADVKDAQQLAQFRIT